MSRPPFIETFTGKSFRPLDPVAADIDIEDIAHALSNQCRFSGHVRTFYSVAEHSVRVSWLVREYGGCLLDRQCALLHDAPEGYLVDLPTPLKAHPLIGDGYREAEATLAVVIGKRFGIPAVMPEIVHRADAIMLATEVRDLMPNRPEHWCGLTEKPTVVRIEPWSSTEAKARFLTRFHELFVEGGR